MSIAAPSRAHEILAAIPKRPVGPPRKGFEEIYQDNLRRWGNEILILDSKSDFKISSRGWCYILEQYGLGKGDFDIAEAKINECRKAGYLPLDICAEDARRLARGLEVSMTMIVKSSRQVCFVAPTAHTTAIRRSVFGTTRTATLR